MELPKQDPKAKAQRSLAADGKCYFSYAQIAQTVSASVPEVEAFAPDVFVAIGGGGFIPARMLRTEVKKPILAVSLELYDDATKTANETVWHAHTHARSCHLSEHTHACSCRE